MEVEIAILHISRRTVLKLKLISSMNRVITWSVLNSSHDGKMALRVAVELRIDKIIDLYGHLTVDHVAERMKHLNDNELDMVCHFKCIPSMGGLIHVKLSHACGEPLWLINTEAGACALRDRIRIRSNGLFVTPAPAHVQDSWLATPPRYQSAYDIVQRPDINEEDDDYRMTERWQYEPYIAMYSSKTIIVRTSGETLAAMLHKMQKGWECQIGCILCCTMRMGC